MNSSRAPAIHKTRVAAKGEAAPASEFWQADFATALRDPNAPVPALFAPCDAEARFAVYRNNSAVAEIGALKEQFPTVLQLVGDNAFSGLARAFARKKPPRSPILGDFGEEFPEFVAEFLSEQDAEQTPYLPDVARLDWACLRALRAEEAEPCDVARLAALDPARIGEARARTDPALAVVASDWPLLALRDPEARAIDDWRAETILVLRPQAEARLMEISPGAAAFLHACAKGATLADAAEAGAQAEGNFDFGGTLVALAQAGAFVDFIVDT
jgi:hypothetical protein